MYCPERVEKICRAIENGETKEKAAKMAGISTATFCEWQNRFVEFSEAVKRAEAAYEDWQMNGILADAKKSLKILICGQEYEETKTEYASDSKGNPVIRKQTTVTKKVLPSATAVIFALCNRDPEHWQNRVAQDISGKIETDAQPSIPLSRIPDGLLGDIINSMLDSKDEK